MIIGRKEPDKLKKSSVSLGTTADFLLKSYKIKLCNRPRKYSFGIKLSSTGRAKASIYISSVNISQA